MSYQDMQARAAQSVSSQANRVVDIQENRGARGAYGEVVPAWATVATGVACKITPKSGSNMQAFGKLAETITHLVTFASDPGVTNNHRLRYVDATGAVRVLMVDWKLDLEEQNALFWVGCREYVT